MGRLRVITLGLLGVLVLGIIQGLTEFLPVSSTGHIILAEEILHFQGPPGKVFEIVIQLGAILAVCFLYRLKIWTTVQGVLKREPVSLPPTPAASCMKRLKNTAWRASSTCWVARKYFCSSFGAASM